MSSICKTKKRLKTEVLIKASVVVWSIIQNMPAEWCSHFPYKESAYNIDQLKQELQQLKRKKMDKPLIDPSTLTEEQREKLKWIYEGDALNLKEAEMGFKWLLKGEMRIMECIFGENFFKKGE